MQDVCISFWEENGKSDMMLKVTDICSTDPSDPTYCADPTEMKIDRTKAKIMYGLDSDPEGDSWPQPIWWFFTKCWADVRAYPVIYLFLNSRIRADPTNRAPRSRRTRTMGTGSRLRRSSTT